MKAIFPVIFAAILAGCGKPQSEIDALKKEVESLKARTSNLEAQAKQSRALPIRIDYRQSKITKGRVYQIFNLACCPIPAIVYLSNSKLNKSATLHISLPTDKPFEIGIVEGWDGNSGDVIEITSQGYNAMTKSFEQNQP